MPPNTTAVGGADLDDWSFSNWPAVVFYLVKSALSLGIVVIAVGIIIFALFMIAFTINLIAIGAYRLWWEGRRQASTSENITEQIPMQDRNISDEESAEQSLMPEEYDIELEEDSELPTDYDGKPPDVQQEGFEAAMLIADRDTEIAAMTRLCNCFSMVDTSYVHRKLRLLALEGRECAA